MARVVTTPEDDTRSGVPLELARRLEADDLLEEDVFQAITAPIADHRMLTANECDDIRRLVKAGIKYAVQDICGGGVLADDARALVTRDIAASCVREGIAPAGVHASLAAAFDRGTVRLMEYIRTLPIGEEAKWRLASDASNSVRAMADRFRNGLDHAYEEAVRQQLGTRRGSRQALVERLLVEEGWQGDEQVRSAAKALGVHVVGDAHLLVIVQPDLDADGLQKVAEALANTMPNAVQGLLIRPKPLRHAVLLNFVTSEQEFGDMTEALDVAAQAGSYIVVTRPVNSLVKIASQYAVVQHRLPYVKAYSRSPTVVPVERLEPYAILGAAPLDERWDCVRRVLGRVLEEPEARREQLLDTLRVFRTARDPNEAATPLHVAPSTVRQRRQRIEFLTGKKFGVPADRFDLDLAIRLYEVAHSTMG